MSFSSTITKTSNASVLRVHAQGEVLVESVYKLLLEMEYAYNCGYVFDNIVEQAQVISQSYRQRLSLPISSLLWNSWWPPSHEKVAAFVPNSDRLRLKSVRLESPGFWEFAGSLNPLKFILDFINLRHEHQKDRDYKNLEESKKLQLENELLQTKLVQEKISILRELGATDTELAILRDHLLGRALNSLSGFQDSKQLVYAEMVLEGEMLKRKLSSDEDISEPMYLRLEPEMAKRFFSLVNPDDITIVDL